MTNTEIRKSAEEVALGLSEKMKTMDPGSKEFEMAASSWAKIVSELTKDDQMETTASNERNKITMEDDREHEQFEVETMISFWKMLGDWGLRIAGGFVWVGMAKWFAKYDQDNVPSTSLKDWLREKPIKWR